MKKNIFVIAVAAFALCMASCQKEENLTLVPVNNGGENIPADSNVRVKSTSDLHGTEWTYTMTLSEFIYDMTGADMSCMPGFEDDTMAFGLTFDGTYAHFSFPDNVMAFAGEEGELSQIFNISYEYSYDGSTHTGYLIGVAEDENGNDVPAQLQFTYDDATDVITFNLSLENAETGDPVTLTMNFVRNEE